jgi:hypothetical protein
MVYGWDVVLQKLSAFLAFLFFRMLISPLKSDVIFSCACCGYYGDQVFEDFFNRRLGGEDVKVFLQFVYVSLFLCFTSGSSAFIS